MGENNEKITGPILSDEAFFGELDDSFEGVAAIKEIYKSGNTEAAYRAFGEFLRGFCAKSDFVTKTPAPEFTERLKAEAERALRHEMVSVGVPMQFGEDIDWFANPTYNGYKEWTWQLSRHGEIIYLARAYRASGEEKYAKEAIFLLLSWIRQATCPEYGANPYSTIAWRTIEAGIRLQNWITIIHTVSKSPYFTDEAAVKIAKSLYEHGMRISSAYTHGNWLSIELCGMANLVGGMPIFKKNGQWLDGIIKKVSESVVTQIYPDNVQYELAPAYQGVSMSCARSVERTLLESGIKMPDEFYKKMAEVSSFYLKMRMANGEIPPINDSVSCHAANEARLYYGTYGGSEEVRWLVTEGREGKAPDFNTAVMPYAGFVAFRTGWGENDISAFFDAGKFGRDHFHEDKLNFLLYSAKKPLVYEMGTYAYDESPMRIRCTQSLGHNVVTVDGLGQNRISTKVWEESAYLPIKEDLRYFSEGDIEYAFGYYNGLWGNPKYDEADQPRPLATHMRSIIMIKGKSPRDTVFAVLDRMMGLGEKKTYRALWQLNVENLCKMEGGFTSPDLTVFTDGFNTLECFTGVMEPKPLGWISRTNLQNDYYAAPQLVLSAYGEFCQTFLTVFTIGSAEDTDISSVGCTNHTVTLRYKNGKERTIDLNYLDSKATIC